MKFPEPISILQIADWIGASVVGDKQGKATGINEIHKVENGDLVFVDHPKYYSKCIASAASYIIIDKAIACPPDKALLVVDSPFDAYLSIVRRFRPYTAPASLVSSSATIGAGTVISPGVFIGDHVCIGENCIIHPHVTIHDRSIIGDGVIIQSGSVIGSEPFYYNAKKDRDVWYRRMESCGRVVVEDEVEIGASCTIDRGVTHDTRIGRGTKMDNMVHVGHDTIIGRNCLLAAQVGIAGAVVIGDGAILWGQVGVSKTLSIGNGAVILGQSGVSSSIEGGKIYFGSPVQEAQEKRRELVWVKRISELWGKVAKLEKNLGDTSGES